MVQFCWNLHHSYYPRRVRHCLKNFLKIQIFTEKGRSESLHFFLVFVQLPKSKKLNILQDKTTPSGYPKIAKSRPYLAPIFHEKYDYFLSYFGPFLVKKRAWSHFKVSESNLLQSHNSGACSSQKSLVPELPSFAAIGVKGRFFQFQTTFSSLAAFLGTMPLL